jgi:hypothetical protein
MTMDNAEQELARLAAEQGTVAGSVYTKTYNTPARTIPAATAVAAATTGSTVGAATNASAYGYTTAAQADAIPVAINALEADVLALKQIIVALVTDLEAAKIVG